MGGGEEWEYMWGFENEWLKLGDMMVCHGDRVDKKGKVKGEKELEEIVI